MKKIKFAILSAFVSLSYAAQATCEKADPWDPATSIQGGQFDGECIVTSVQRSLVKVPAEKLNLPKGDFIIANFRHNKKFWLTLVHADAVDSIAVEKQVIAGTDVHHVRARLKLTKPFELLADQSSDDVWDSARSEVKLDKLQAVIKAGTAEKVDDIVLSIEAARTESNLGKGWDPSLPAGSYALVSRMASYASLTGDSSDQPIDKVIPLDFSKLDKGKPANDPALKQKLLVTYIGHSEESGLSEAYGLITKNCSIELLKAFDRAWEDLYPSNINIHALLQRGQDAYPELIDQRLLYRGLAH